MIYNIKENWSFMHFWFKFENDYKSWERINLEIPINRIPRKKNSLDSELYKDLFNY